MEFQFKCATCDEVHVGMPSFAVNEPSHFWSVPEAERVARCDLASDVARIDEHFFVRGCLDIPVDGTHDVFTWGVWVSLSAASAEQFLASYDTAERSHIGPFLGWLNTSLAPYPETLNLKTHVHLRNNGSRPFIELEPTDHPLAIEQRAGISQHRVGELYSHIMAAATDA
jgi:hypothetical protein